MDERNFKSAQHLANPKELSPLHPKFHPLSTPPHQPKFHSAKEFWSGRNTKQTRQFNLLRDKLASKEKMKAVSRGFNKSLYGKLARRINIKPASFYKFGLKQQEKKSCKTIFRQIFNVSPSHLEGTFSVSELWSNKNTLKYLKQNKMFFNKEALIQQFEGLNKNLKERKIEMKERREKQVVKKLKHAIKESRATFQRKLNFSQNNPRETCCSIRSALDRICKNPIQNAKNRTQSRRLISNLEKDHDLFSEIGQKYKGQMIILL